MNNSNVIQQFEEMQREVYGEPVVDWTATFENGTRVEVNR